MNYHDAICASDFDGGEPEPTDICMDCQCEIVIGFLRCTACEAEHERQERLDLQMAEPRR